MRARPRVDCRVHPRSCWSKVEATERSRRRKSTLNRVINTLKACLNHAASSGKPANADAWAQLKKFRSTDSVRSCWLTVDEAQRLQNAHLAAMDWIKPGMSALSQRILALRRPFLADKCSNRYGLNGPFAVIAEPGADFPIPAVQV